MARADGSVGGGGLLAWAHAAGQSRRGALVTLVVANALWAGTYAAGKIALADLDPIELNALRFSIAALVLAPALIRGWRRLPRDRSSLWMLAFLTLIGFVLNKAFEYYGLALSTASDVALLIATESLFTAALSWTVLRERVTIAGGAAMVAGLAGAYLIVERGYIPTLSPSGGSDRLVGDLLVIVSLLLESGYTIFGKRAISKAPPLLFTAATITGSLFVWIPAGAVAVAKAGLPHISLAGWLGVLYMALAATVAGYWLWFRGLAVVDASVAAPVLFIQPLLGAALGIWLLKDPVTWATWSGAALIFTSLLLVARHERPRHAVEHDAVIGESVAQLGESVP